MPAAPTVDAYAAALAPDAAAALDTIRRLIAEQVPNVEESIRYQMPVFAVDGTYIVYVGAWKQHVGLYPIPELPPDLEDEIRRYRTKKDTVRFVYRTPIPYELIGRLVAALVPIRFSDRAASDASADE